MNASQTNVTSERVARRSVRNKGETSVRVDRLGGYNLCPIDANEESRETRAAHLFVEQTGIILRDSRISPRSKH